LSWDELRSRRDDLRVELTNDGIQSEQLERLLESRDEYTAERVFWAPPEAR
jgi:type I restriction enzyme M protein